MSERFDPPSDDDTPPEDEAARERHEDEAMRADEEREREEAIRERHEEDDERARSSRPDAIDLECDTCGNIIPLWQELSCDCGRVMCCRDCDTEHYEAMHAPLDDEF